MNSIQQKHPLQIRIIYIFMLLNALVWLALGVIVLADLHPAIPDGAAIRRTMGGLLMTAGILMLALAVLLRRRKRIAYWLTLALLAPIIVVTIMDQFGLSDLTVVLMHLLPFALLLKNRDWFLQSQSKPESDLVT